MKSDVDASFKDITLCTRILLIMFMLRPVDPLCRTVQLCYLLLHSARVTSVTLYILHTHIYIYIYIYRVNNIHVKVNTYDQIKDGGQHA